MADSFAAGSLSGRIVDTAHGPEIALCVQGLLGAAEIARLTVGELETLARAITDVARSARAKLSARHRLNNLPMRS